MKRTLWTAGLLALAGAAGAVLPASAGEGTIVGQEAPEISTKEWINSQGRTRLADMRGEVVFIASWKTG
jgi:hypothetical protein